MGSESARYGRRRLLRLGGAALAAALFASCSSGDDSETEPTSTNHGVLAADQPPPSADAAGVLRTGVVGDPTIPPRLVYAALVAVDPRDDRVRGDLAEVAEITEDYTIAVTLHPDATYHADAAGDFAPLTAASVARDFEARQGAGEFLFSEVVDSVEATAERSLTIRLRAPFSLIFEFLGDSTLAGVRGETRSAAGMLIGSGPFVPQLREDGGLSLLAHPRYHHLGLPLLDEVRVIHAEREQALDAAFGSGSLDVRPHPDDASLARASEREGAVTFDRPIRRPRGLGLSLVGTRDGTAVRFQEAFQDERVRLAIAHALDQDAIARLEDAVRAGPVGPGHVADALPPDELAAHPVFTHDRAEAASLLAAAGIEGLAFSLEAPRTPPLRSVGQLIERQLTDVGLEPQLDLVPVDEWERHLQAGDFDATIFELTEARTPDVGLRLHATGGLEGTYSPWGYSNPEYDEALAHVFRALEPRERAGRAREAQRLLLDSTPAMFPLPVPRSRLSLSPEVGSYAYDAYEYNEQWLAARWNLGAASDGGGS